jgi:hypothetical protein
MKAKSESRTFLSITEIRQRQRHEDQVRLAMRDIIVGRFRDYFLCPAVHEAYHRAENQQAIQKLSEAWAHAFAVPLKYDYGFSYRTTRPHTTVTVETPLSRITTQLKRSSELLDPDHKDTFHEGVTTIFHEAATAGYNTVFSAAIKDYGELCRMQIRLCPQELPDGIILAQPAVSMGGLTIKFASWEEFYSWCADFVEEAIVLPAVVADIVAQRRSDKLNAWALTFQSILSTWFLTMKQKYQQTR